VTNDDLNAVGGHCPVCGQEYRPGFAVCADDGAELVPGPAPQPEADVTGEADDEPRPRGVARPDLPPDVDDLHDLGEAPAVLGSWPLQDALLLAGNLRSHGVRAAAETDLAADPYRFQVRLVRVLVVPEDLERAHRIAEHLLAR